jgi:hypothetical protein
VDGPPGFIPAGVWLRKDRWAAVGHHERGRAVVLRPFAARRGQSADLPASALVPGWDESGPLPCEAFVPVGKPWSNPVRTRPPADTLALSQAEEWMLSGKWMAVAFLIGVRLVRKGRPKCPRKPATGK